MKLNLYLARLYAGFKNRNEPAKKLGISQETLFNYEKGRSTPNAIMIDKMLNLYGLKYEQVDFIGNK